MYDTIKTIDRTHTILTVQSIDGGFCISVQGKSEGYNRTHYVLSSGNQIKIWKKLSSVDKYIDKNFSI